MSIESDKFASYKLLTEPLKELGYSFSKKKSKTKIIITYQKPKNLIWKTKIKLRYPFNTDYVERLSINKDLTYTFIKKGNISTPYTVMVDTDFVNEKLRLILNAHSPLVVKPNNSSASKGLSLGITSTARLKDAITKATQISKKVLVQKQVEGEEVRLTFLNGKFIGALLRQTPQIIGDGNSSIAELIKNENSVRANFNFKYITYPLLDESIINKDVIQNKTIPHKDEVIKLSRSTMISGGCSIYNISKKIDIGYVNIAAGLIKKIDAGFLTVDLICKDFSQPPIENNYYLIEFNTSPALKLYYSCRDGNEINIIPLLAQSVDEWLSKTIDRNNIK